MVDVYRVYPTWDVDDWDIEGSLHLPDMVEVPKSVPIEDIADWLSDRYGFCVYTFDIHEDDLEV